MKSFEQCQFDKNIYERELIEFEKLLVTHNTLEENKHILPFFRQHPQIVAQMGTFVVIAKLLIGFKNYIIKKLMQPK